MKPLVAIVGRPNVGKSTLFNRIIGRRAAIVEDVPGVTRDRHYAESDWSGRAFMLVDTGGFEPDAEDIVRAGMARQAQLAVDEAQATILVIDAMAGVTVSDEEVVERLRRSGRPVIVAANKIDSVKRAQETSIMAEVHALGFPVVPISAEHGRGIGDLLDEVIEGLPEGEAYEEPAFDEETCRIAVVGRPNVGKSTLVNRLLGSERMLATELPGTTRDSVDAELRYQGRRYVLTDTAGIRRKKSISLEVERYSVVRALRSAERSDVVVLVLDATEAGVSQDSRLASLALERGRGLVAVVNKWDLMDASGAAGEKLRASLREKMPVLAGVPLLLVSALEGKRVFKVLEEVDTVFRAWTGRVPTPDLNTWLEEAVAAAPPPLERGRSVRLLYMAQVGIRPPTFLITGNRAESVPDSYRRYLENRLREAFGFEGVPVRLVFKSRRPRSAGRRQ